MGDNHWEVSKQGKLESAKLLLVIFCITGFFLLPNGRLNAIPLYLLAMIVLVQLFHKKNTTHLKFKGAHIVTLLFIGYTGASCFWAENSSLNSILSYMGKSVLLALYLIAISSPQESNSYRTRLLLDSLLFIAVLTGLFALGSYIANLEIPENKNHFPRISGWNNRLRNPAITGLVYGFITTISFALLTTAKRKGEKVYYSISFCVSLSILLLTFSRGAVIGAFSAIICHSVVSRLQISTASIAIKIVWLCPLVGTLLLTTFFFNQFEKPLTDALQHNSNKDPVNLSAAQAVYVSCDLTSISSENGTLSISNQSGRVGVGWPAFPISNSSDYLISAKLRSKKNLVNNIYIRVQEFDGAKLTPDTIVSANSDQCGEKIVKPSRQIKHLIRKITLTNDWTQFSSNYHPTDGALWASIILIGWDYPAGETIEMKDFVVSAIPKLPFNNLTGTPWGLNTFNPILQRGFSSREIIWPRVAKNTFFDGLTLGHGISANSNFITRKGVPIQHAHSIYLSVFFYGGLIGVILFSLLLVNMPLIELLTGENLAPKAAITGLTYTLFALFFDGDRLIVNISYLWIIFWLPIGMLLTSFSLKGLNEKRRQ
jgi:hypothetical protein